MAIQTLILIRDQENADRMELVEFTEAQEAERYLEQLLADGADPSAVRVFNAEELDMQISHRPVVSLNPGGEESRPQTEAQEAPSAVNSEVQAAPATHTNGATDTPTTETRDEPFVRDGVRFSELFKPAGG